MPVTRSLCGREADTLASNISREDASVRFFFFFSGIGCMQPQLLAPRRREGQELRELDDADWRGQEEASVSRAITRQLGSHLTWLQQVVSWMASQVPGSQEAPRLALSEWMVSSVTRDAEAAPVLLQPAKAFSKVVSF